MAYIKEQGNNRYLVRISCGYDENGKLIQKSRTFRPSGDSLTKAQVKKELNSFVMQFEVECKCGQSTAESMSITLPTIASNHSDIPTFAVLVDDYRKAKRDKIAITTWELYESYTSKVLIPMFGKMRVDEIRPKHIQQLISYLSTPIARKDKKGEVLSPATIRRYLTIMQSIMTFAYKFEYIDNNPADTRRLEIPKVVHSEIEVFNDDEVEAIIDAMFSEPLNIRALIGISFFTGARRGEIVGLKWDDIDMEKKSIHIRRSIYKLTGQPAQEKPPKTASSVRSIAIPDMLCQILTEYKEMQTKTKERFGSTWNPNNYLFTEFNGDVMNPQTPTKQFSHFLERHGIRHLKLHGVRHTSATWLLSHGCDIKTVSKRLGHTSIDTTNIYVHSLEKTDQAAAASFDMLAYKA